MDTNTLLYPIDLPESDYLYIQASQLIHAGKGLFTAIDVYASEVLSIFKGEVLSEKEAQRREAADQDQYFIVQLDGRILDSKHVACFAKYANDAEGLVKSTFQNNTKITLDDDDNVCLVALRDIQASEEIFCAYGEAYWKKHGTA